MKKSCGWHSDLEHEYSKCENINLKSELNAANSFINKFKLNNFNLDAEMLNITQLNGFDEAGLEKAYD